MRGRLPLPSGLSEHASLLRSNLSNVAAINSVGPTKLLGYEGNRKLVVVLPASEERHSMVVLSPPADTHRQSRPVQLN